MTTTNPSTGLAMVRPAEQRDLAYMQTLSRRESEAIGYVPWTRYEGLVGARPNDRPSFRLWVVEAEGDTVGFLYLTPGRPGAASKIIQVCVQEDARRLEYASALVAEAEQHAIAIQRGAVSIAVAEDLEARAFWDALGYVLIRRYDGGHRRGRRIERRAKPLPCGLFIPDRAASEDQR